MGGGGGGGGRSMWVGWVMTYFLYHVATFLLTDGCTTMTGFLCYHARAARAG